MLLLDVGEDTHVLRVERAAVTQELTRGRLDDALVGDVREDEALDPHEARAARERHGQGLAVRAGEHLDTERQTDDEAFDIWTKDIKVPRERVARIAHEPVAVSLLAPALARPRWTAAPPRT